MQTCSYMSIIYLSCCSIVCTDSFLRSVCANLPLPGTTLICCLTWPHFQALVEIVASVTNKFRCCKAQIHHKGSSVTTYWRISVRYRSHAKFALPWRKTHKCHRTVFSQSRRNFRYRTIFSFVTRRKNPRVPVHAGRWCGSLSMPLGDVPAARVADRRTRGDLVERHVSTCQEPPGWTMCHFPACPHITFLFSHMSPPGSNTCHLRTCSRACTML